MNDYYQRVCDNLKADNMCPLAIKNQKLRDAVELLEEELRKHGEWQKALEFSDKKTEGN